MQECFIINSKRQDLYYKINLSDYSFIISLYNFRTIVTDYIQNGSNFGISKSFWNNEQKNEDMRIKHIYLNKSEIFIPDLIRYYTDVAEKYETITIDEYLNEHAKLEYKNTAATILLLKSFSLFYKIRDLVIPFPTSSDDITLEYIENYRLCYMYIDGTMNDYEKIKKIVNKEIDNDVISESTDKREQIISYYRDNIHNIYLGETNLFMYNTVMFSDTYIGNIVNSFGINTTDTFLYNNLLSFINNVERIKIILKICTTFLTMLSSYNINDIIKWVVFCVFVEQDQSSILYHTFVDNEIYVRLSLININATKIILHAIYDSVDTEPISEDERNNEINTKLLNIFIPLLLGLFDWNNIDADNITKARLQDHVFQEKFNVKLLPGVSRPDNIRKLLEDIKIFAIDNDIINGKYMFKDLMNPDTYNAEDGMEIILDDMRKSTNNRELLNTLFLLCKNNPILEKLMSVVNIFNNMLLSISLTNIDDTHDLITTSIFNEIIFFVVSSIFDLSFSLIRITLHKTDIDRSTKLILDTSKNVVSQIKNCLGIYTKISKIHKNLLLSYMFSVPELKVVFKTTHTDLEKIVARSCIESDYKFIIDK